MHEKETRLLTQISVEGEFAQAMADEVVHISLRATPKSSQCCWDEVAASHLLLQPIRSYVALFLLGVYD